MKLSVISPFVALSLCILGLFAMRLFPSPWVGLGYGVVVLALLILGIGVGIVSLFGARRFQLEKSQIVTIMVGTIASWFLLSFLVFFAGKAYLNLLAS